MKTTITVFNDFFEVTDQIDPLGDHCFSIKHIPTGILIPAISKTDMRELGSMISEILQRADKKDWD